MALVEEIKHFSPEWQTKPVAGFVDLHIGKIDIEITGPRESRTCGHCPEICPGRQFTDKNLSFQLDGFAGPRQ